MFTNRPFKSLAGCQYYGFTSTLAALAEIWSLAAVSCDRLQAIFNPLDSQKRITKSQVSDLIKKSQIIKRKITTLPATLIDRQEIM